MYLRFQYYEDGQPKEVSVPKELYTQFGISDKMSVMESKERVKRLNSERSINAKAYINATKRHKNSVEFDETYFPEDYIEEFLEYLEEKTHGTEGRFKKVCSHFATAQRMVRETKLIPEQYSFRGSKIYKWFVNEHYSPDYCQSIIRVLNLWGVFVSRKEGRYFEKLDNPRGRARSSIASS